VWSVVRMCVRLTRARAFFFGYEVDVDLGLRVAGVGVLVE